MLEKRVDWWMWLCLFISAWLRKVWKWFIICIDTFNAFICPGMSSKELETASQEAGLPPFGNQTSLQDLRPFGRSAITRGAFGEISLALLRSDASPLHIVAIKTFDRVFEAPISSIAAWRASDDDHNDLAHVTAKQTDKARNERRLRREVVYEIKALTELQSHVHVVDFLGLYPSSRDKSSIALAFSYCPTDLSLSLEWRRKTGQTLLSFPVIRQIVHDIFQALCHCHSNGFVHRDVKPGNFLVTSSGYIQLCDFGLVRPVEGDTNSHEPREGEGLCTLYYRPPEVLLGVPGPMSPAVDMFSAGLVVTELLTGRPLWPGSSEFDQLGKLFDDLGTPSATNWPEGQASELGRQLTFTPREPRSWRDIAPRSTESDHLSSLLNDLVALDPEKRMSSHDALAHEWMKGGDLASRNETVESLVPLSLEPPLLLCSKSDSSGGVENEVPIRQVLGLAECRRNFLSKLNSYNPKLEIET